MVQDEIRAGAPATLYPRHGFAASAATLRRRAAGDRTRGARVAEIGYHVLAARDGFEALQLASRERGGIDLLLTDVIIRAMSRPALAARVRLDRPGTRALFMSDHRADMVARRGVLDESRQFMEQPFAPAVLAKRVRDVLDGGDSNRGRN